MLPNILSDARILWHLAKGHPKGADHASNLNGFYARQAPGYDAFRERLLPGRQALYESLALPHGAHLVELGAGTGRNLEWIAQQLPSLKKVDLVDLCQPLLAQASQRWNTHRNVECHLADATQWQPETPVDAVVFAYALTMIPDWRSALENAWKMLRPGGKLAVVDFTLSAEQSRWGRLFWRQWFAHDGVHLDQSHCRFLQSISPNHTSSTQATSLPYLPWMEVPYYSFIGEKTEIAEIRKPS